ncbi:MAG: class I SAM-dependent methyltransferase [Bacteroidales bacterium]|jgi:predicted O-methyltransferase YrrM|nr:class I SAM-dependent methyltransferase [Bacteroidales bacterium]
MNNYRTAAALRYFLCSGHRKGHGIHSPFAYDFISNVMLKDMPEERKAAVKYVRKRMEGSKTVITVNDLGAGSGTLSASRRCLCHIARRSSVHPRYGKILHNLASASDGKDILEMGTSLGISTLYLAMGAPSSKIVSIEGCQELSAIAEDNFSRAKVKNVEVLTGDFDKVLPELKRDGFRPSLVFVDGNHIKEAVLRYFTLLKELITANSVIIFDDINYSFEMNEAWKEIKSDLQVSLTIDIFQMGLVFFRKGMAKQDLVIRY